MTLDEWLAQEPTYEPWFLTLTHVLGSMVIVFGALALIVGLIVLVGWVAEGRSELRYLWAVNERLRSENESLRAATSVKARKR